MEWHKCKQMPEGALIEKTKPYIPKPAYWTYFRGILQHAEINYCPYCGEKLEQKEK